jgi:hypothetical protein
MIPSTILVDKKEPEKNEARILACATIISFNATNMRQETIVISSLGRSNYQKFIFSDPIPSFTNAMYVQLLPSNPVSIPMLHASLITNTTNLTHHPHDERMFQRLGRRTSLLRIERQASIK